MLSALLTAAAVYMIFLAVHWIPFRLSQIRYRTRTMTLTLLLCLPLVILIYRFFSYLIPVAVDYGPFAGALFYAIVFTLLWCGYVQFVFSFDTSPSLRVLVEILARKPSAGVSEIEIKTIMNFKDTFRRRFQRAVGGGAIVEHKENQGDEKYLLAPGSVRLAKVGKWAKELFQLGAGG